jgi:hypothetical protein
VADIKEKNYEEEEGAGAGAARRGLAWFGLVQVMLHNILGQVPSCVFALFVQQHGQGNQMQQWRL